jgi:SAM-dependent methyltransferase
LRIGIVGQRVLDVGTGTLARRFAETGCFAVGLGASPALRTEAVDAGAQGHHPVHWVSAPAEATGLPNESFDVVCAGQCWHLLDGPRAAIEAARLLRTGGRMLIAYFTCLPQPGTAAEATEKLLRRHNPNWAGVGHDGRHPGLIDDLQKAGLLHLNTFDFVLSVSLTHQAWRKLFRAHDGLRSQSPNTIAAFDSHLERLLVDRFPDPILSEHRLYGVVAARPLK